MNQKNEKKILWYSLAFMAFGGVWGFGNVINGFSEYNGLQAIVAWIIVFGIYFVPYALMVGEVHGFQQLWEKDLHIMPVGHTG